MVRIQIRRRLSTNSTALRTPGTILMVSRCLPGAHHFADVLRHALAYGRASTDGKVADTDISELC